MANRRIENITPLRTCIHYDEGQQRITYRVQMDQDELDDQARKAARSKSSRSKDGPILVTIISRERVT